MSNVYPFPGQADQEAITINFLERVLPSHGGYCACVKKGGGFIQTFHKSIKSLWAALQEADRGGKDVYFAPASFSSNDRTIEACAERKSLELDIDYGPGHARPGYETFEEARDALKHFCEQVPLPTPMVVKSGGGFHAYWTFKEAISREKWQRYADGLKAACLQYGLKADNGLTINSVHILRVPGTFNRKLSSPRPVELDPGWLQFGPYDWPDVLLKFSNVVPLRPLIPPKPEYLDNVSFPEEAFPNHYESVDIRALATSCGVVGAFEVSGDTSEPTWMRLANLFHYVQDGERLFHNFSKNNYPDYSHSEAQKKWSRASGLTGPPLCKGFKDDTDEKTRAICLACPLLDTIKTPLQGCEESPSETETPRLPGAPTVAEPSISKKPPYVEWEKNKDGFNRATFKNAVMALSRLDVSCTYDEFHLKKFVNGRELDDSIARVIREKVIVKYDFDPGKMHMQEAIDAECERNRFDPLSDYLKNLQWDGMGRIDFWLSHYLGADDTELNRSFARKTLLAGVRRVFHPGCKFDQMLVLEGPQGAGKSSAWRILAGDENFSDQPIKWDDPKQQKEASGGIWIHEIAELTGLRKADEESIKSFLSRQNDRGRAAYAHNSTDQPRRCIHVGTINPHAGYVRDPTGARRFWPVKIGKIDLNALRRDRDQLWAEAVHYEASGEPLELPAELYQAATVQQELRRVADPWDDVLAGVTEDRVSNLELMQKYLGITNDRMSAMEGARIAAIMRRLKWDGPKPIWFNGKTVRGYERS